MCTGVGDSPLLSVLTQAHWKHSSFAFIVNSKGTAVRFKTTFLHHHKVVYKSRGLCTIFQVFGAASIRGRPICNVLSLQNPRKQSGTTHSTVGNRKRNLNFVHVTKLFPSVNKHFGMQKRGKTKPYMDDIGPPFSSCGFYLSAAFVQLEFGESAASIQVQLLYRTSQYLKENCTRKS